MAKEQAIEKKYLKLGKHASSFNDALTNTTIAGQEVVAVHPGVLTQDHIAARIKGGHITEASKAEYDAHVADMKQADKDSKKDAKGKKLAAKSVEVDDDDDDDDDDDEDDDEDDDDEDDDDDDAKDPVVEKKSKDQLIKELSANPLVKNAEKKNLPKLSQEKLQELFDKLSGK